VAQIVTFPRTSSFVRQFEELALFTEKTAAGDLFYAGLLDGEIEVAYDRDGDWHIANIDIKIENGRIGENACAKFVNVNPDDAPALYWLLLDRLTDVYAATIAEWVAWELAEAA
jgi:hypothetical protein